MEKSFMGSVIFTEQVQGRSTADVRAAAEAAGIDPDLIRELNQKFVFIRAMNSLKKADVLQGSDGAMKDKLLDDQDRCMFQFSRRFVESQGAHYDPSAMVTFNKSTGEIYCPDVAVRELAQKLFAEKVEQWQPNDIGTLIKRVLEASCKRIMLRHGVYFIPYQAAEKCEQVEQFLTALKLDFWVLPVGMAETGNAGKIHKAIVADMIKEFTAVNAEIAHLQALDAQGQKGGLTDRKAKNRLADLQAKLCQYRQLAEATQVDLGGLLKQAGEAGDVLTCAAMGVDALIARAQTGKPVSKLVVDLLAADTDVPADAVALLKAKRNGVHVEVAEDKADPVEVVRRARPSALEIEA